MLRGLARAPLELVDGAGRSAAFRALSTATRERKSLLPRIVGFTLVSGVLSSSAVAFTLLTDESALFWARDNVPTLMSTVAPWLGLAQFDAGELQEPQEPLFTDIKEVVGEQVFVGLKLSSGQVKIVQSQADQSVTSIVRDALAQQSGRQDMVVDVVVLDDDKAKQYANMTSEQVGRDMNAVRIPVVPEVINEHTLQVALELCRQNEVDLEVRARLAPNEFDRTNLRRAMQDIQARKKEIKLLLREDRAKSGPRSIFRRTV